MKKKVSFAILILFLLGSSSLFASDTSDQENISNIQKKLFPHARFYTRKTILGDLLDPSKQLEAARFLYKQVKLDKDYLAAQALLDLKKTNVSIATYLSQESDAEDNIEHALKVKSDIDKERLAIDSSVSKALEIMRQSGNLYVKKSSIWLEKPLPNNRIKCCAVQLLSSGVPTDEINQILGILSTTRFGIQQVEKAKEKSKTMI